MTRTTRIFFTRRQVVRHLHEQGGSVHDKSGYAIRQLLEPTGLNVHSLSSLLTQMDKDEFIARTIKGKRTYEIMLNTDHPDVQRILNELPQPKQLELPEPEPQPVEEASVVEEPHFPNSEEVADALLRRVITIINTPPPPQIVKVQDEELVGELRHALEQATHNLNTALQVVKDQDVQIDQLKREVKDLKSRVARGRDPHLTQQLRSMLSPADWDKLMREVPQTPQGE